MLTEEARRRVEIVHKSGDYPSDRKAAICLGVDRTTIIKYRRNLQFASRVGTSEVLDGVRGRKRSRRVVGDPHVLCRWIKKENPTWTTDAIRKSLLELGHRITNATVEQFITKEPNLRNLHSPVEKGFSQESEHLLLDLMMYRPVRALALLNEFQVRMCKVMNDYVRLAERCATVEEMRFLAEVRRFEKECRILAKETQELITSIQGRDLHLDQEDLSKLNLRNTARFPWLETVQVDLEES